jgi:hypothetical protein
VVHVVRNQFLHNLVGSLPRFGSDPGKPGLDLGRERDFHTGIVGAKAPIANLNKIDSNLKKTEFPQPRCDATLTLDFNRAIIADAVTVRRDRISACLALCSQDFDI